MLRKLASLGLMLAVLLVGCSKDPVPLRKCDIDRDGPLFESQETLCDGVDNDCDGLTDVLVPGAHTACTTKLPGVCGVGVANCQFGKKVCLTQPPHAESWDGKDNDCDGQTDEGIVETLALPAMARIAVPPYLFEKDEDPRAMDLYKGQLDQAGIPYEAPDASKSVPKFDWGKVFGSLDKYRLIIVPGYVLPSFVSEESGDFAKLEAWIKSGGVLIWNKPVGPKDKYSEKENAHAKKIVALGGVSKHTQYLTSDRVRMTGEGAATLWLEHGPERNIHLTTKPDNPKEQLEVFTFEPLAGTEVLAHAYRGDKKLGATWLRRKIGQGAVYTLGFDPTHYTANRCYVNCFDPGIDIGVMLLKGAWREAGQGHYVVKHTVPGVESGVLLASHDIDAPDSHNAGEWGGPGAPRMAEMEREEDVQGTYFVTTDYVTKYYNPAMVKRLCQLDMCPEGGHSIQHLYWGDFPRGDCSVTKAQYKTSAPTVCGEVNVNLEMLRQILPKGRRLDSWRTPYLEASQHQYSVLAEKGIRFDSSLATGDLRSNFPIDLPNYVHYKLEDVSKIDEMWVFPVNIEDGIGWYEDGVEMRREVSQKWLSEFKHRWAEQMEGNGKNGAWNVLLVHPSFGIGDGVGPDNLQLKIDAVRWAIRYAKKIGLHIAPIAKLGDFWRGRHGTKIDNVVYENGAYKGRIVIGKVPARKFSLEFGDRIADFQHNTTSTVKVVGQRVVFDFIMPAGAVIEFTAVVDKSGK
ncbi:MAG: hypothetical protein KC502_00050 [Myxococcales bacterium]|nr:hypothetical protein [Myxococcales bacterium]